MSASDTLLKLNFMLAYFVHSSAARATRFCSVSSPSRKRIDNSFFFQKNFLSPKAFSPDWSVSSPDELLGHGARQGTESAEVSGSAGLGGKVSARAVVGRHAELQKSKIHIDSNESKKRGNAECLELLCFIIFP
jgi:hypothetical protein